ncbi:isocitrate/isopropylmalate dehydrogenase family protein [Gemmobacter nectariphilus]|uniref:isocitrate/isopropylmalate dehydrogenase family protein n=1 Tax=Gemmobacter nectariphilus TaxID=220343 RepID=UPI0004046357|nr:isocitrate/isopropylmalate family dehydrogenase [Gemmobacter nectariphilus]
MDLLVLEGDGIGPEITAATVAVIEAAARRFDLPLRMTRAEIGFAALERSGTTIPPAVIAAARAADGVILGPVSHNAYPPVAEGGLNPSGVLRRELELYANIRPARSRPGTPRPVAAETDLVIVRENLEGFYADRNMASGSGEVLVEPDVAIAMRKITARGSARIAEAAFALAAQRPRKCVTTIHKANVLRISDGLFLSEVRKVAARYPQVTHEELLVDAAAAHLVRNPARFDVVLATNMFGDILSDLASEISGGLGLAASLNLGVGTAVAQAQHGSAPDLAGQDRANPASLVGSAAMLLRHLGAAQAARAIDDALDRALSSPETRTPDLGGALGTAAFGARLAAMLQEA